MISKIHYLKTLPEFFRDVQDGRKTFEIRKDDRDYNVGDYLLLREWDPTIQKGCHPYLPERNFTGKEVQVKIKYILRDYPEFGLMPGYAILSIELGFWFN